MQNLLVLLEQKVPQQYGKDGSYLFSNTIMMLVLFFLFQIFLRLRKRVNHVLI